MNETAKTDDFGNVADENITIIKCALNVPMIFIAAVSNTLVLAAILSTPSLRSPSIVFLCSLVVSDFLVGLVLQPVLIADSFQPGHSGISHARKTFSPLFSGVSLCTMTAISVDRFLALHYHMRYPSLMTEKRAIYTALILWIICFLFSCLSFWRFNIYFLAMAILIVICILISTFSYVKIYRIVRQHQQQIRAQQQAMEGQNAPQNINMVQSRKNAINTFIFYILMVVCYSPVLIYMMFLGLSRKHTSDTWVLTETIAFLNSSIDPFVFCWRFRGCLHGGRKILALGRS